MKYKGYIKLEHEVEAENEEQAKEKIADYWDDALFGGFDSSSVELDSNNKGKWIDKCDSDNDFVPEVRCSVCGAKNEHFTYFDYCPYCGAEMENDDDNED